MGYPLHQGIQSPVPVDVFALLGTTAVQKELKLDDGQKAKIAKMPEEVRGISRRIANPWN